MTWFLYALLAAILMTLINFGDKFIVESQVPNPLALIVFLSFFNLLAGLVLWAFVGFELLPFNQSALLIIAGMTPALAGFFYFQAVSRTETTRIVILSQLSPIFTLILSVLFLNESLSLQQLLGFGLILVAAIAVTLQRSKSSVDDVDEPLWDVFILMIITNIIAAGGLVLTDSLVNSLITDVRSLTLVTAYAGVGYWLGGMLLLFVPRVRQAFLYHIQHTNAKALLSLSGVESIFVIRQFVLFMALTLGPVSLVSVIGSLNVFFAVAFGWVLTLWQPHIFKEDISRSNLIQKFAWATVAFIGIILLR